VVKQKTSKVNIKEKFVEKVIALSQHSSVTWKLPEPQVLQHKWPLVSKEVVQLGHLPITGHS